MKLRKKTYGLAQLYLFAFFVVFFFLRRMTSSASVINSVTHSFRIFLAVKNCLVFLTFPYPMPVPKNCVFFIGCHFESRANQVGVHQQKKDCASVKEGKVSLLRREAQSQGCALTYGARSPKATKTWPRGLKILSRSAQPGGMLVLFLD